MGDDVLTADEAARLLGVTTQRVLKESRLGLLAGVKVGREWRYRRQALIRHLEQYVGEREPVPRRRYFDTFVCHWDRELIAGAPGVDIATPMSCYMPRDSGPHRWTDKQHACRRHDVCAKYVNDIRILCRPVFTTK
jgi:excisionase family DNA binding protein